MVINIPKKRIESFWSIWPSFVCLFFMVTNLLLGCVQVIRPLSAVDSRVPSEAKQRIADAEDAVLIARSRSRDAQLALEQAQERQFKFDQKSPNLGAATGLARQVNSAKLNLARLEADYASVDQKLSESRLQLVYAQTSMRYDIAIYDLQPLDQSVSDLRTRLLKLRKQKKQAKSDMKSLVDQWWTAYQGLANSSGTQAFWVHELVQ